jgi:hypothetical protein
MLQTSQRDLPDVIGTLRSPTGLAGRLDRGQQYRHENADDGDHGQELNECEGSTMLCAGHPTPHINEGSTKQFRLRFMAGRLKSHSHFDFPFTNGGKRRSSESMTMTLELFSACPFQELVRTSTTSLSRRAVVR